MSLNVLLVRLAVLSLTPVYAGVSLRHNTPPACTFIPSQLPLHPSVDTSPCQSQCVSSPGRTQTRNKQPLLRMAFEFHEAQQSKEYNLEKVKGGYLKTGPNGLPIETMSFMNDIVQARTVDSVGENEGNVSMLEGGRGDGIVKYMPSFEDSDPIVQALKGVCGVGEVQRFELLDSRWNGNEVMKYITDVGNFFVKINRVEYVSVFKAEAVSLTSLIKAGAPAPKPLHIAALPRVGEFGPGAFLIIEHLPLVPFGSMTNGNQQELGRMLGRLHSSHALADVHKGRFGFVVNNFLSRTPLNNTWCDTWSEFFVRRLRSQLSLAFEAKAYGRAALNGSDAQFRELGDRTLAAVGKELSALDIKPALLHGDLWIGNTGATQAGPVMFDPASFFGHAEFDLALASTQMFGGFSEHFYQSYHELMPKQPGFESRERMYLLYHYLNQLNLFGDPNVRVKCVGLMESILAGEESAAPSAAADVE